MATYQEVFRQCNDAEALIDAMIRCRENREHGEGLDVEALELVEKPLFCKLIQNSEIAAQYEGSDSVAKQIGKCRIVKDVGW